MVVNDAIRDARFSQAPVVVNEPHIRFYAGANLKSYEGYNVGTICVFDLTPRILSDVQRKHLSALARQVSHVMELDRSLQLLKEHNKALVEIGQIQSHELRNPVSSILGIMEMIKEDDYNAEKEYLVLLEAATKKLDEKIRLIVNHSNTLTI
jgi:GAF domain-containing protein